MFGLLLTLLLIDGLFLTVIVLLQSGKGGGLASMGGGMGTDTLIGGRQAATILTKATWTAGGIFLVLSLILAGVSSRQSRPNSILRDEFKAAPAASAPAPALPGAQPAATPATQPRKGAPATAPKTATNQ